MRLERTYIEDQRKVCNDGAARRVAPVKGPDPKLRNESCRQVSCMVKKLKRVEIA